MSPEKQRIAIAEACGWRFSEYTVVNPTGKRLTYLSGLGRDRERSYVKDSKEAIRIKLVPDYLNDANTSKELIEHLRKKEYSVMFIFEGNTVECRATNKNNYHLVSVRGIMKPSEAICEVFLKALRLWKD